MADDHQALQTLNHPDCTRSTSAVRLVGEQAILERLDQPEAVATATVASLLRDAWPNITHLIFRCILKELTRMYRLCLQGVQGFSHVSQKGSWCEGFLKKQAVLRGNAIAYNNVWSIARHINDLHFRPCGDQLVCHFRTTEPREHHIGQQQVDGSSMGAAHLQGLFTASRL